MSRSAGAASKGQKSIISTDNLDTLIREWILYLPIIHPGHQKYRGDFFQEWDSRQRVIHDRMWPPYMTVHQAKNANMGVWPKGSKNWKENW